MATSSSKSQAVILLTGVPGVGKTTLMGQLYKALTQQGVLCSGFITEEVRSAGRRVGFDVVTLDGSRGQLARISDQTDSLPGARRKEYKVGQYSVNLLSFESTALPAIHIQKNANSHLETSSKKRVVLVDEIGKMELFSDRFIQAVRNIVSQANITLVATVPVPKGKPLAFVEEMRSKAGPNVFEVTRANRNSILPEILSTVVTSAQS